MIFSPAIQNPTVQVTNNSPHILSFFQGGCQLGHPYYVQLAVAELFYHTAEGLSLLKRRLRNGLSRGCFCKKFHGCREELSFGWI